MRSPYNSATGTRTPVLLLFLSLLLSWCFPSSSSLAQIPSPSEKEQRASSKPTLRIGIAYRGGSPAGQRMLEGIRKSIHAYNEAKEEDRPWSVEPVELQYGEEKAGLQSLLEVIEKQKPSDKSNKSDPDSDSKVPDVDVILGPSDSGLYLHLMEFRKDLEAAKVVVLSPVVTAAEGNKANEWLFRTNVQVTRRAQKIFDHLVSRGFNTITVAYESSGFGDRAEHAFSELASQTNYKALRFRSGQLRGVAATIVEERPSAVGLLGQAENIGQLQSAMKALTSGVVPYDPLVFTITDASTLCLEKVRFVTLYKGLDDGSSFSNQKCGMPPGSMTDEFTGLGYDTADHLLRIADKVGTDRHGTSAWRINFRYELAASLQNPTRRPTQRTGMTFYNRENTAEPAIRWYNGKEKDRDVFAEVSPPKVGLSSWGAWLEDRIDVRKRRFGILPLINIALVIAIVGKRTFSDVKKSFTGSTLRYLWRWTFLRFVLFNVFVAIAVLFTMAEWGTVRWDNTLVALSIAFGYTMLLKTSIFETPSGQAFGLAQIYEKAVKDINRRLMVMRYDLESPRVYFLSYTNSLTWLRDMLVRVYRESEDRVRADRLISDIDEEVRTTDGEIEKRRVYARHLLDLMSWRQLVRARLVPFNMKEHELYDPTILLREAAHYSSQVRPENGHKINAMVMARLAQLREQKTDKTEAINTELNAELNESIAKSTTERGRTYARLDWLVTQQVIDLDHLRQRGFVDPAFDPLTLRSRLTSWLAGVIHRNRDTTNKPVDDPTGERRATRRLPISGNASLVWRQKADADPKTCAVDLCDISTGGIGLLLKNKQPVDDILHAAVWQVDVPGKNLLLKAQVDHRGHTDLGEQTRVNLQWVNPTLDTLGKVTEYVKAPS